MTGRSSSARRGAGGGWWLVPLLALAVLAGLPSSASAQCRVKLDSSIVFGAYDPLKDNYVDSEGQLSWRCQTWGTSVMITISRSPNASGTQRRLKGTSGDFLNYDLYRNSSRTTLWGDGTFGSSYTETYPGGGWVTVKIYGRIPAGQDVGAGSYSDSPVVTINF